jgi:Flp pilus assembly protein TadD
MGLTAWGPIQAVADCDVAEAISLEGRVEVQSSNSETWKPVSLGDHFCPGDKVRLGAESRAGLVLNNDTLLRLDEHTSITINASTESGASWLNLIEGVTHFISRIKGKFKVGTPYVNASIEGTEFVVEVDNKAADIIVFEGVVAASNAEGSIELGTNQSGRAELNQAPVRTTMANPRDAVAWTLYYPPLAKQPDAASELAEQTVTAIAQNRVQDSEELARQAIETDSQSAAAYMAQSYVDQANFDIPAALSNSKKAAELAPDNAMTQARLAEVWLMNGDLGAARSAAEKAVSLDPNNSHTQTVLGFSSLREIKSDNAISAFEKAIQLDSSAPLPRLGLGLAMIREGELAEGRREIETAVLLDPNSALLRSYLGKAYFEEKRDDRASTQLSMAKELDPNDPTPWYYDALLKQIKNRPAEALEDMQTSIALNDKRAVYRSRLLLDQDEAARNTSQARIYSDLGFDKLAINQANRSVQNSPETHSAHRLLSDSYAGNPHYDRARASELLLSQLLQPLNTTPLQPQLSVSNLGVLDGAGPSSGGYSEFTPLFTQNGFDLQFNVIGGSNDSLGNDLVVSGLHDLFSYSIGQYHYETEGWRDNNDLDQDIYNAFLQASLSPDTSIQFEYQRQEFESGDLAFRFDPTDFSAIQRNEEENDIGRIGFHHHFASGTDLIASVIYQNLKSGRSENSTRTETVSTPFGPLPATIDSSREFSRERDTLTAEAQLIHHIRDHTFVLGAGNHEESSTDKSDSFESLSVDIPVEPFLYADTIDNSIPAYDFDTEYSNAYLYSTLQLPYEFDLTLGATYADFEKDNFKVDETDPKVGLTWTASENLVVRAAYMESLSRPADMERGLEPTQVAGFNQLLDQAEGSEIKHYGFGIDITPTQSLSIGAEYNKRDLVVPLISIGSSVEPILNSREEDRYHAYLYWSPLRNLGLSLAYENEQFERTDLFPTQLKTERIPISLSYFWTNGFYVKTVGTHIDQEVTLSGSEEQEDFWNLDTVLGYRFPNRFGKVEIIAKNLLDEEFRYYDLNFNTSEPLLPQFQPEQQVFIKLTINF